MPKKMSPLCASFRNGRMATSRLPLGCRHYARRCRIVAPCCGEAFWCRHCHNEAKSDGKNSHEMDRTEIREVICQRCHSRQVPSEQCIACGEVFGDYFCEICNLWDDDGVAKQVFHCDKCKICRVGGRENFFHCDTCGSCYPNEIRSTHTCVENAMHQSCSVCLLNLFQSTSEVAILRCGHTLHQECLHGLQESFAGLQSIRCPLCNVSLYEYEDLWAELDRQVAETPMPAEYTDTYVHVTCNDCQQLSAVKFHVLGHKCQRCNSYNTRRD
mmetsp:Transcript_21897/g.48389  ORF Transcript_21897/g.48389 Transcript_21897/m.48389 type:complete len:271 (+) Transcript_21897:53-865(+)